MLHYMLCFCRSAPMIFSAAFSCGRQIGQAWLNPLPTTCGAPLLVQISRWMKIHHSAAGERQAVGWTQILWQGVGRGRCEWGNRRVGAEYPIACRFFRVVNTRSPSNADTTRPPTRLLYRLRKKSGLKLRPLAAQLVGVTRFELVTSSVSGKRSPPELNAQQMCSARQAQGLIYEKVSTLARRFLK